MGVEVPDYPSNAVPAVKDDSKLRKKKVDKVISGTVRPAKKSTGRKFAELFLGDDISNVKEYIIYDRLVPGIKEMFLSGLEMMLFGGDRVLRRRDRYDSRASYVSYNKMYSAGPRRESRRDERRERASSLDEYIFETKGEALEVLDTLTELIDVYDQASVTDFYDAIGVTGDFTDCNYGWTELGDAHIRRVRGGGYILDLPRPMVLR